jgi:hypothetical protein
LIFQHLYATNSERLQELSVFLWGSWTFGRIVHGYESKAYLTAEPMMYNCKRKARSRPCLQPECC